MRPLRPDAVVRLRSNTSCNAALSGPPMRTSVGYKLAAVARGGCSGCPLQCNTATSRGWGPGAGRVAQSASPAYEKSTVACCEPLSVTQTLRTGACEPCSTGRCQGEGVRLCTVRWRMMGQGGPVRRTHGSACHAPTRERPRSVLSALRAQRSPPSPPNQASQQEPKSQPVCAITNLR